MAAAGCSSDEVSQEVPMPGSPAPDFQLQSLDGQTITLSGLRGKPVLINFWATWCGPCRIEMPFLQGVSEDPDWLEQELVILAVNLGESPGTVRQFMEANNLDFTVLIDAEHKVSEWYNAALVPTTYFIDKDGIIKDIKVGPFINKADVDWRLLNSIMEEVS
jgi:peroxiredoxin